jgi:hypothetical protein
MQQGDYGLWLKQDPEMLKSALQFVSLNLTVDKPQPTAGMSNHSRGNTPTKSHYSKGFQAAVC